MIGLNELQHRVSRLDNPYQFVELCAALVLATAAKNSVALSGFSWNLNISEPDGGVDQRFIGADKVVPRIIPGKTVVYQCKAGDGAGSANDIALNDVINKSNVKRRLEDGDHFVYFAGRKRHAEFERDITEKLKENGFPVPEERIHYLGPEYLAGLLRNYPGLLARYLNLHHECLPLDKWSERASMSNPFVSGESPEIQSRLTSLSNHLMSGTGFTEIYGAAGNGKSRMVLEALKTCGQEQEIEKHVLYTHDFKVAEKLISRIRDFPEAEALLVADDLEPSEIRLLKDLYPTCPRGFGIVAIGLDTSKRDSGGVFSIPSVSAETLNLILQKALPGLPGESRKRLAELCSGSPKLAVLLAEKIDADPSILQRSLLTNQEARDTVAELLSTDWSPEQLKALSAVALFSRLGWDDEYEKESEIIFKLLNLDFSDSRQWLEAINRSHGIVPPAGRYRYVSPALLADHLAAQLIDSLSQNQFRDFIATLADPLLASFSTRLKRVGRSVRPNQRRAIEEVLGPDGPFKSLDDISGHGAQRLLLNLSTTFPVLIALLLQRITAPLDLDQLRNHRGSRRTLSWCLENILWVQSAFEVGGEVLFRLATAENETIGNNATAIWLELFQLPFGRTETPFNRRLKLLKKLEAKASISGKTLIVQALGRALKLNYLATMGVPSEELPGAPIEHWRPRTQDQVIECCGKTLRLLSTFASDKSESIREAIANALVEGDDIFRLNDESLTEKWLSIAQSFRSDPFRVKKPLVLLVDHYESAVREGLEPGISDGVYTKLVNLRKLLTSQNPRESLKSFLMRQEWTIDEARLREEAAPLVELLKNDPSFFADEARFLSTETSFGHLRMLIRELASDGADLELVKNLLMASSEATAMTGFLVEYLETCSDKELTRAVYDLVFERKGPPAWHPLKFAILGKLGYSPDRLTDLLELLGEKPAEEHFATLRFSGWVTEPTDSDFLRILEHLGANETTVILTLDRLREIQTRPDRLLEKVVWLVENFHPRTNLEEHRWARLGFEALAYEPLAVISGFLKQPSEVYFFSDRSGDRKSHVEKLIPEAWECCDRPSVLKRVIEPLLTSEDPMVQHLTRTRLWFIQASADPSNVIVDWVSENPTNHGPPAATMAGEPGEILTELQEKLLSRFEEVVGETFYYSVVEGFWSGPASAHWARKLKKVQAWEAHQDESIRVFARKVRKEIERILELERREEDEDEVAP